MTRAFKMLILSVLVLIPLVKGISVNTTEGEVVGQNATDGNYYTFYGIHYGGDTSGINRFKAPTPPPRPPGAYHAHDATVVCAQPGPNGLIGTENCLTLSIFTSGTTPAKPVVVWLTGEEYTRGGNQAISFRRLVSEGIVIVQLNYRLSIFGFLCLRVPEAPGNAGLKDIVQGLKWIKANIQAFGGDPNNVILLGHGSAAAMVDLITLSPSANGLVQKAVALSGSALSPWAVAYEPIKYAQAFGERLSYTDKSNEELAQLLISTDKSLLVNEINGFQFFNNTILFAPCIENPALNDTFLHDAPINILRSGNYSHVPFLTGYTDREGTLRAQQAVSAGWLEKMQTNFSLFLQADLDFGTNLTTEERNIREYYFSQRNINMETIEDYLDYQGDTLILVSVIRGARERALTSRADVRLFEFTYRGTRNSDWIFNQIPLTGARHGSIINYLLDYDLRDADQPVMMSIIRRFVAFFNSGVPNTNTGSTWSAITTSQTLTLNYFLYSGADGPNSQSSFHTEEPRIDPHVQRMTLWNRLYSSYYVPPKFGNSAGGLLALSLLVLVSQVLHFFRT